MNDFIKEIKEDIKRERFDKIFNQYGTTILGLSALVVLGVAAGSWFNGYRADQQEQSGELYRTALVAHNDEKASLFNDIVKDGTRGYQQLSAFSRAKVLVKNEQFDKAISAYDTIRKSSSTDKELRYLADLLAASIEINHDIDSANLAPRFERLVNTNTAWNPSAVELKASYLIEKGQQDEALLLFKKLSASNSTPYTMKERAEKMTALLSPPSEEK